MIRLIASLCAGLIALIISACAPGTMTSQQPVPSGPLEHQLEKQQLRITAMEQQLANLSAAQRERDKQYTEVMDRLDAVLAEVTDVRKAVTASRSSVGDEVIMRPPQGDSRALNTAEQDVSAQEQTPTEVYRRAFAAYTTGKHAQAQKLFEEFANSFPDNEYVANARFWQGEACLAQGLYPEAEQAFIAVEAFDSQSPKVPFAKLKRGLIKARQGDTRTARRLLEEVRRNYPDTEAAEQAATALDSGHLN